MVRVMALKPLHDLGFDAYGVEEWERYGMNRKDQSRESGKILTKRHATRV